MKSIPSKLIFSLPFGLAAALLSSHSARAADTLSSGANGTTAIWGTIGNWLDNTFPTAADDVIIDRSNGSTTTVLGANATQAANSITFGSGSGTALGTFTLRANTSGTTGRSLAITTGNITVGTSVTGAIKVGEIGFGTLSLDTSAAGYVFTNNNTTQSLTLTSNFTTTGKTVTFADAGGGITLDVQLATPTFASLSGGAAGTTIITNNGATGSKTLTLNATSGTTTYAGKITDGATATITLTKSSTSEQILSGANTYTGLTTISSGILTVSGTHSGVGATTLSGGTLNVNNAGALSSGLLSLTSGTLDNTSGAAITSQTNNPTTSITAITFGTAGIIGSTHDLNMGTGAVTYVGSGTPGITFAGVGSTLTFDGSFAGLGTKGFTVNGAGNSVSFGSLNLNNSLSTNAMTFLGSGNITIVGGVSDGTAPSGGYLTYNGTGKLTLLGAGSYTGKTTVSNGIVNIQNATALGTTAGVTSVASGATLQIQGSITVGAEALTIAGGGAAGTTGALQNLSGTNNYGGVVSLGAAATIASDSGTLNLTDASVIAVSGSSQTLTLTGAGNGSIAATITTASAKLTKEGTGTWTLIGGGATGNYVGVTTINAGTLQFAKTVSLYNGVSTNWTPAKITAASGATLALNVGGTGEFSATDLNTLLANISVTSSATTGLQAGAKLGFDTTNAGGSFTQGNVIANSTGANGGAIGVNKLGAGTLVLDKTNTYTGATTVTSGKLVINGNISTSTTTVKNTATLGGGGTTGAVIVEAGGKIAPGNSAGELTVSNGLTLAGVFEWELGALSTSGPGTNYDRVTITAGNADITGASLGLNLGAYAPTNISFWQTNQTWAGILNNSGAGSLTGTFGAIGNSSWSTLGEFTTTTTGNDVNLVWTAIPEPNPAVLVGGLGMLALLRRRRR